MQKISLVFATVMLSVFTACTSSTENEDTTVDNDAYPIEETDHLTPGQKLDTAIAETKEAGARTEDKVENAIDKTKERVENTAHDVKQGVKKGVHDAAEKVEEKAKKVKEDQEK